MLSSIGMIKTLRCLKPMRGVRTLLTSLGRKEIQQQQHGFEIEFERFVRTLPYTEEDVGQVHLNMDNKRGVAFVVIDNPKKKNALTGPMMIQLSDIASKLSFWKEGKAVVVMGTENQFCSGGDLKKCMNYLKTPEQGELLSLYMQYVMNRFSKLPFLSVAVVQGHTVGGGAEITTACNFRVMQENSKIGFVQSRLGVTPGFGGGTRLTKLVGHREATKLLVSGRILSPSNALNVGLCDAIFPTYENATTWTVNWLQEENLLNVSPKLIQSIATVTSFASCYDDDETSYSVELDVFKDLWRGEDHNKATLLNIKHR